jgi:phage terminase large subunit-like protein
VPPRFGTPRNTDRETLGPEVGVVAKKLGMTLMPWQQHAVDVGLEVDPESGELWYEEIVITVPRQSGKTTLIMAILVWRCVMLAKSIGFQTCTYIAQSGKMARRKLEREFARLLRASNKFVEIPQASRARPTRANEWKLSMNNNGEHILFGTQSYLGIDPPTEDAAHGDVLDMPVIDEAFSREDDLVEQAVDAATVTRWSPQTFVISTAGNERSRFLARKVLAGRKAVDDPLSRTCYLEWSVPEDEKDWDKPETWARYLPALGHTITVKRLLARLDKALRNPDEVDEDGYEPGVAGFKRGYLNIWPRFPQFGGVESESEIQPAAWEALAVEDSELVGDVVLGVGVGADGASAAIVVAGRAEDGVPQVATLEKASGTWWLEGRLRSFVEEWQPVVVAWDNGGAARVVSPEIKRAGVTGDPPAELLPLTGREWNASCEAFKRAVVGDADESGERPVGIKHLGDLLLRDAIAGCVRRDVGEGWKWDVDACTTDPAALLAATAALRAVELMPEGAEEPAARVAMVLGG